MTIDHVALYVKDLEGAKDFLKNISAEKAETSTAIHQPGSAHTLSASLTEVPAEPGLK